MDFSFDDEHLELRELCRSFATKEITPFASEWSEQHVFPTGVFKKLGELGLMGMLVDSEYGGSDAGYVAYVTAM